jgi:ketopantoate reductase
LTEAMPTQFPATAQDLARGVATPANRVLYALLKLLEEKTPGAS